MLRHGIACVILMVGLSVYAADWPAFRGADRNGMAKDATPPLKFDKEKNVKWKVALPARGNSSPIVSGDRVFLTCEQDKKGLQRSLYCFNRAEGKQLWVRTVSYEQTEPMHDTN